MKTQASIVRIRMEAAMIPVVAAALAAGCIWIQTLIGA